MLPSPMANWAPPGCWLPKPPTQRGLPGAAIIAAQSAGGSIGNAIAPANIVLGASTAGISGQEGAILRKTIPWTVVSVVVTGLATVLLIMFTGASQP